ncbi:SDR family oxidoreductase [Chitinophaga polysaccharea]|uniref:SDR family oxidoreductase n=1 Tax=Chitinophaga polysaccharea TaxID=1293035 RepID=UPI00293932DD|nr:SDR family oxidoreductase [Chitinophaga polysaccharea]
MLVELSQHLLVVTLRYGALWHNYKGGPVWTPLIPSTMPEPEKFGSESPMKRPAQPAEIAPAYVFLASEEASYIAGATLPITGGKVAM